MNFTPKIPDVLVYLGRAVELLTEKAKYTWTIKDKCNIYANDTGSRLYILRVEKSKTKPSKEARSAKELYKRWSHGTVDKLSMVKINEPKIYKTSRANHIIYWSDLFVGDTNRHIHTFETKPLVWLPKKTLSTVVLTGGKISITKGGIEG